MALHFNKSPCRDARSALPLPSSCSSMLDLLKTFFLAKVKHQGSDGSNQTACLLTERLQRRGNEALRELAESTTENLLRRRRRKANALVVARWFFIFRGRPDARQS